MGLQGRGGAGGGGGEGSGEGLGRFVCSERLRKHFLFSPLPAPFIKAISILKTVRNPAVLRIVRLFNPLLPTLADPPSLLNTLKAASPASGSTMGCPGLMGGPGLGPARVRRQVGRVRPEQLSDCPHSPPAPASPASIQAVGPSAETGAENCLFRVLPQAGPLWGGGQA